MLNGPNPRHSPQKSGTRFPPARKKAARKRTARILAAVVCWKVEILTHVYASDQTERENDGCRYRYDCSRSVARRIEPSTTATKVSGWTGLNRYADAPSSSACFRSNAECAVAVTNTTGIEAVEG